MKNSRDICFETERFVLRLLNESDATNTYLSWLTGDSVPFIESASDTESLLDLKAYIVEKTYDRNVIFMGIFLKENTQHIGNLKFEPVSCEEGYAVLGILVGDENYRGKGVAGEVIQMAAIWLKEKYNIEEIFLGVDIENTPAIKAYKKCGFAPCDSTYIPTRSDIIKMRLSTSAL